LVRSAGKNCAAISAHVDHERRRLGIDPLTGKYRPVIFEGFEYTYEYRTNSDGRAPRPTTRAIKCTHRHKQREKVHRVLVQAWPKKAQSITTAT
jgi:hypothetical protein